MRKAIFTIVSNNYLHYARTLFETVAAEHPECDRLCFVVDRDPAPSRVFADEFASVPFDELGLPDPDRFAFRYSILELNTAVKPWAFAALFARGYGQVVYLDPDIALYGPLTDAFALLDDGANLVLTPHLLAPVDDDRIPSDLDIRKAGTYNLGFCAATDRDETRAFVRWWQSKLVDRCVVDFEAGVFVDQSWIDLVPGLFAGVAILRHPGYNVAYWNLAQRRLASGRTGWTANDGPLVFFHFSGFDPGNPHAVSKHQNRYTLDTLGDAKPLLLAYAERVLHHGARTLGALPYGFGTFRDGRTPIPDAVRKLYRRDAGLQALLGDDPFAHPDILATLRPASRPGGLAITHAMQALLDEHASIREAFPATTDASIDAFYAWFVADARAHFPAHVVDAHAAICAAQRATTVDAASSIDGRSIDSADASSAGWPVAEGWSVDEPGVADHGVWAAPSASLPCVLGAGDLTIEGDYPAGLVARQHGSSRCELVVAIDRRRIATATLDSDGPFTIRASIPEDLPMSLVALRFTSSSHFVPRTIGLGDDARELAWRVRRIVLGGTVLLDHAAAPPLRPFATSGLVDGVNLVGYLLAESGVGESVRAFARACDAAGFPYSLHDVGYQSANRQDDRSIVDRHAVDTTFPMTVLHVNADQTPATLRRLRPSLARCGVRVAYWHWEQAVLPRRFLPSFDGLAEVWVPSDFVRDAVASIAPVPVFKVPHAIAFAPPVDGVRARFGLPDDRYLVLVMYDFDSYQVRKNPQAAIEAFRRGCGARGDAGLVIKTINHDRDAVAYRALLNAIADLPNVHLIDRYLDRDDVHALEHACDCFVSLHRSEGFGLGLAEMMFLGKPVVATGWSGNMEFMTPTNSFPVPYRLVPLDEALGVYDAGPSWAEADVDRAGRILRTLVDDPALGRTVGARAAAHMREHHAPARIGARYRQRLDLIAMRRR